MFGAAEAALWSEEVSRGPSRDIREAKPGPPQNKDRGPVVGCHLVRKRFLRLKVVQRGFLSLAAQHFLMDAALLL